MNDLASENPLAVMRTKPYVGLLVLAALLGVPISAAAYFFLQLVKHGETWIYSDIPKALGFTAAPAWWPLPVLAIAGLLVGATIQYLPGTAGHIPAKGFQAGGSPTPLELPAVFIAALLSLAMGAVVGPEAPLIALGGGLAGLVLWARKRDAPAQVVAVVSAAGAFAAVSFLLGNPIIGAFLIMEASGVAGDRAKLVLLPGLLCAGIGYLTMIGLDSLTGFGQASLAIPAMPAFVRPDGVEFLWAVVIGCAAAPLGSGIREVGLRCLDIVQRQMLPFSAAAGAIVATIAIVYAQISGKSYNDVLFSGQDSLPSFVAGHASYTIGVLVLLLVCKSVAYGICLSSFRGGPIFPAMFIGAAGGMALSHFSSLPLTPAVAMGVGAMSAVMLRLPMTSVLLATLILGVQGIDTMPLVIVAVVIAFIISEWLVPSQPADTKDHNTAPDNTPPATEVHLTAAGST